MKTKSKTKRRGNGEGSIFQRSSDGLWVATVTIGYDESGKRKRKPVYGKTKKEVHEKLKELHSNSRSLASIDAKKFTVAGYLKYWMENVAKKRVEKTTYERYESTIRLKINPHIGGVRLGYLSQVNIQSMYTELEEAGESARTQEMVHNLLHNALKDARKQKLIVENPTDLVVATRSVAPEFKTWTATESQEFLKACRDDRLYSLYVLALSVGLRQGELLALKRSDIDLERKFLSVRRSAKVVNNKVVVGCPKTKKSRRRVHLPEIAVDSILNREREKIAEGNASSEWLFCTPTGVVWHRSNFRQQSFKPLIRRAGVPIIRFHDLRHTCATLLLSSCVHPKVVQELLGHSKISTTLDTYGHVIPTMQESASAEMDSLLSRAATGLKVG